MPSRGGKGKKRRQRELKDREPKLEENVKSLLSFQGGKSSEVVQGVLRDLTALKKPFSKSLNRKNLIFPFEDHSDVENLARPHDCSLFAVGTHSKKRPHNLILGRLFNEQLLDMVEFGVDEKTFRPLSYFAGKRKAVVQPDFKPMFVFQGEGWELSPDLQLVKNLFLDIFRGQVVSVVNLAALERVFVLSAIPGAAKAGVLDPKPENDFTITFRHYGISLHKSSSLTPVQQPDGQTISIPLPRVELEECGPRVDLNFRRRKQAVPSVVKESLKKPKMAPSMHTKPSGMPTKQKNISRDALGNKLGLVHMQRQDYKELHVQKPRALKVPKSRRSSSSAAEGEE